MPSKREKAQQALDKILNGKYGEETFWHYYLFYTIIGQTASALDPALKDRSEDIYKKYHEVGSPMHLLKNRRQFGDYKFENLKFNAPIQPTDAMLELVELLMDAKENLRIYAKTLPEKHRPLLELPLKLLDWDSDDIPGILTDHPYLGVFASQVIHLVMPVTHNLGEGKPVIDYSEREQGLNGPDNTGLFDAFSEIYQSIAGLMDGEIERRRLLREGYTPEQKQACLTHIKTAGTQFVANFDKLQDIERKFPGRFGDFSTGGHLQNELNHIIGISNTFGARTIHKQVGALKGTLQAIDNGWDLDELDALALPGDLSDFIPFGIRKYNQMIQVEEKFLKKSQNAYQAADEAAKKAKNEYDSLQLRYAEQAAQTQKEIGIDSFKWESHLEYIEIMQKEIRRLEDTSDKELKDKLSALSKLQTEDLEAAEKEEDTAALEYQKLRGEIEQQIPLEMLEAYKAAYEKTRAELDQLNEQKEKNNVPEQQLLEAEEAFKAASGFYQPYMELGEKLEPFYQAKEKYNAAAEKKKSVLKEIAEADQDIRFYDEHFYQAARKNRGLLTEYQNEILSAAEECKKAFAEKDQAAMKKAYDAYDSIQNKYAELLKPAKEQIGNEPVKQECLKTMQADIQHLEETYQKEMKEKLDALTALQAQKQPAAEAEAEAAKHIYEKLRNEISEENITPEEYEAYKAAYEKTVAEKEAYLAEIENTKNIILAYGETPGDQMEQRIHTLTDLQSKKLPEADEALKMASELYQPYKKWEEKLEQLRLAKENYDLALAKKDSVLKEITEMQQDIRTYDTQYVQTLRQKKDLMTEYQNKVRSAAEESRKAQEEKEKCAKQLEAETESRNKKVQELNQKLKEVTDTQKAVEQFKAAIWNKKVRTKEDKLEVLDQIAKFAEEHSEAGIAPDEKLKKDTASFEVITKKLRDRIINGTDEIQLLPEVNCRFKNTLNVYGSHPDYGSGRSDISKEDFEQLYAAHSYDTKHLPFDESEIAMICMAATMSSPNAKEAFFRIKKGMNQDERTLTSSSTTWIEDCYENEQGGRQNSLKEYHEVIQAGKDHGKAAMEEYAAGNKYPLAQILHTILQHNQFQLKALPSAGTIHNSFYNMSKAAENLLKRDPELADLFGAINASKKPEERVDLELLGSIRKMSAAVLKMDHDITKHKNLLDQERKALNAEKQNNGSEAAEIEQSIRDQEQRTVHLALLNKASQTITSSWLTVVNQTVPEIVEADKKTRELNMPDANGMGRDRDILEYDSALNSYTKSTFAPPPYYIHYFSSPEMQEDTRRLAVKLENKYKFTIDRIGMLAVSLPDKEEPVSPSDIPEIQMEFKKFMFGNINKCILKEIKKDDLTNAQKRDLLGTYIENLFYADMLDKQLNHQPLTERQNFYKSIYDENDPNHPFYSTFRDGIREYTKTVDLSGLKGEELVDRIRKSSDVFLSDVDDMQTAIISRSLETEQAVSLTPAADILKKNQLGFRGSKLYEDIIIELDRLDSDIQDAKKQYQKDNSFPSEDLAKREKNLMEMMKTYLEKKKAEFKQVHEPDAKKILELQAQKRTLALQLQQSKTEKENLEKKPEKSEADQKRLRKLAQKCKADEEKLNALTKKIKEKEDAYKAAVENQTGENHNSHTRFDGMKQALKLLEARYALDSSRPNITPADHNTALAYKNRLNNQLNPNIEKQNKEDKLRMEQTEKKRQQSEEQLSGIIWSIRIQKAQEKLAAADGDNANDKVWHEKKKLIAVIVLARSLRESSPDEREKYSSSKQFDQYVSDMMRSSRTLSALFSQFNENRGQLAQIAAAKDETQLQLNIQKAAKSARNNALNAEHSEEIELPDAFKHITPGGPEDEKDFNIPPHTMIREEPDDVPDKQAEVHKTEHQKIVLPDIYNDDDKPTASLDDFKIKNMDEMTMNKIFERRISLAKMKLDKLSAGKQAPNENALLIPFAEIITAYTAQNAADKKHAEHLIIQKNFNAAVQDMAKSEPLIKLVHSPSIPALLKNPSQISGQKLFDELSKIKKSGKANEQAKPAGDNRKNGIQKNDPKKNI